MLHKCLSNLKYMLKISIENFECEFNKTRDYGHDASDDGFGELNWEDLKRTNLNKISRGMS